MKIFSKKNITSQHDGFSVIEVLIAMGIFAIGVLGVMSMQTFSMTRTTSAVKNNQAGFYAVDAVEDLMRTAYGNSDLDSISTLGGAALKTKTEGPYTITWAVFSSTENGTSVGADYGVYAGEPIFQYSDNTQVIDNIRANTKLVMVNVTHPLGENARLVFLKPNI